MLHVTLPVNRRSCGERLRSRRQPVTGSAWTSLRCSRCRRVLRTAAPTLTCPRTSIRSAKQVIAEDLTQLYSQNGGQDELPRDGHDDNERRRSSVTALWRKYRACPACNAGAG